MGGGSSVWRCQPQRSGKNASSPPCASRSTTATRPLPETARAGSPPVAGARRQIVRGGPPLPWRPPDGQWTAGARGAWECGPSKRAYTRTTQAAPAHPRSPWELRLDVPATATRCPWQPSHRQRAERTQSEYGAGMRWASPSRAQAWCGCRRPAPPAHPPAPREAGVWTACARPTLGRHCLRPPGHRGCLPHP